jgi:hypothetical protein
VEGQTAKRSLLQLEAGPSTKRHRQELARAANASLARAEAFNDVVIAIMVTALAVEPSPERHTILN